MSDDRSTFETTRARLEDIVVQVRRKDVSLEQSLDMLEEAVRLVNQCNELIDQTSFRAPAPAEAGAAPEAVAEVEVADAAGPVEADADVQPDETESASDTAAESESIEDEGEDASVEAVAVVETFELLDIDADDIEFVEMDAVVTTFDAPIEDDERS